MERAFRTVTVTVVVLYQLQDEERVDEVEQTVSVARLDNHQGVESPLAMLLYILVVMGIMGIVLGESSRELSSLLQRLLDFADEARSQEENEEMKIDFEFDESIDISSSLFMPVDRLAISGRVDDGVNGVYFVHDSEDQRVGIFKPLNEEVFMEGNPNDGVVKAAGDMSPLKMGVRIGDSTMKEVTAYVLDHDGMANVPPTAAVSMEVDGVDQFGSLQQFVVNKGPVENYSSSLMNKKDVQAIALLDLRLMNLDRHMGNMLVVDKSEVKMCVVPIDHGYCLPDYKYLSDAWFEWSTWDHVECETLPEIVEYMESINLSSDVKLLKDLEIAPESALTYLLCSTLVKHGLRKGKTLKDLADMMQRDLMEFDKPCQLERLVSQAIEETGFGDTKALTYDELQKFEGMELFQSFNVLCEECL